MRYSILNCGLLSLASTVCFAQAADEKPQVTLKIDFATDDLTPLLSAEGVARIARTTAADGVDGKPSLRGASRDSAAEWNEFLHSRSGLFRANEAYRVSFDYKILARDENGQFYALFRREGANSSAGWRDWQGNPGATGHIELSLVTRKAENYTLIFGIRNRGAIAINNLVIATDPAHRPPDAGLPNAAPTWKSPGKTAYYLDSEHGNDTGDGRSPKTAWRSLAKVNSGEFAPGDKILLRAGGQWRGILAPGGSGSEKSPITLGRYGSGPKPKINAESKFLAALYLHNVEYWMVSGLDISNTGAFGLPNLAGVLIQIENFGTARKIALKNLDVHDVAGSRVKSEGGGNGIHCTAGGEKIKSRFDGLLIENCRLTHTDRNGITLDGYWARQDWFPSLHVVIRGNRLEDIGGDGIVPIACDGALVERNVIVKCRQRCDDSAAGIWPWSCDNTVIQNNEVSGMKGTNDGQGFDSDWNCRNTVFQYNYSHDNEGGFMLVCNDGSVTKPWNIGNVGTVIRYNISRNDGARTFHFTGPCRDTVIYNNTVYIGKNRKVNAVQAGNWGGDWSEDTRFYNNIFYAEGAAQFDFGGMRKTVFERNLFYGTFQNRPDDPAALLANPRFVRSESAEASGFRLTPGSPCFRAGKIVPDNGKRDFWNRPVPATQTPTIGAYQK